MNRPIGGIADRPSPNHDARLPGTTIDMLVLHYTGLSRVEDALDRLCDAEARVSAHYLIDEDGTVIRLVDEARRAWHAGIAYWRGHRNINGRSIGVELANPGHDHGYRAFPEVQMAALIELSTEIVARYPIPPRNVVGHSDVAPRRKHDPGELFDWKHLGEKGIALWPNPFNGMPPGDHGLSPMLGEIGYETEDMAATIAAFQRRFRPARIDGVADSETCALIAAVLATCRS